MSVYKNDVERLIAEVESMTEQQRLIFIELLIKSFKPHELPLFVGRFEAAAGRARLIKNLDIVKKRAPKSGQK